MDEGRGAQVVEATLGEDLSSGLEPDGLGDTNSVVGQDLGQDNAEGSQEGPAGVDELQLAIPREGLGVGRQTDSVPAVVAGELSGQVGRGSGGEGACGGTSTSRRFEISRIRKSGPINMYLALPSHLARSGPYQAVGPA